MLVLRPCQNFIWHRESSEFNEEIKSFKKHDCFYSLVVCSLAGQVSVPRDSVVHIPVVMIRFNFLIKTLSVV